MMHADPHQDNHGKRLNNMATPGVDAAAEPRLVNTPDTESGGHTPTEYPCVDLHARRTFERWKEAGQVNRGGLSKNSADDHPTGP